MTALSTLADGLSLLLPQFLATLVLLVVGAALYTVVTPYDERALVKAGNPAAGISLAGALVALAIPLAATLATNTVMVDILIWGAVAVLLQVSAFGIAYLLLGDLKGKIEAGNTAAAAVVAGVQIAVALINAGAMAG